MYEFEFAEVFGPTFWVLMAVLTLALMVAGYWLAGVISRKTDTGLGAFMIVVLVTVMVASAFIPAAIFGALGNIMAIANPLQPIDETVLLDQGLDSFAQVFVASTVATGSVIAFFIASIIGLARGRS